MGKQDAKIYIACYDNQGVLTYVYTEPIELDRSGNTTLYAAIPAGTASVNVYLWDQLNPLGSKTA